jgi:sugar lactone lactonase YvrE
MVVAWMHKCRPGAQGSRLKEGWSQREAVSVDMSTTRRKSSFGSRPPYAGQGLRRKLLSVLAIACVALAACDSDSSSSSPSGKLSLLAGNAGGPANADGTGPTARFSQPADLATDSAGNVYVADYGNQAIRKITPAGVVTTLVTGSTGAEVSGFFPVSVAGDSEGNVYAIYLPESPVGLHTFKFFSTADDIRKITPAGMVTTLAGTAGVSGAADGTGAAASFNDPTAVATDSAGKVYVNDTYNGSIREITPEGVVTTLAGNLGLPFGITVDIAGNVYVLSGSAGANFPYNSPDDTVLKVTPTGVVTTLAGTLGMPGSSDGLGGFARFDNPLGLATDSAGNIYVADTGNGTIRKITTAGLVTTLAGTSGVPGSSDGVGASASFNMPEGVATDSAGNIFVADTGNSTIRKVTPTGAVTTLAGAAVGSDGTGAAAAFNLLPGEYFAGITTDATCNVYVADTGDDTIRKITPAGVVTTLAGMVGVTGSADGMGAAATFAGPEGVATDSAGNVYVMDSGNEAVRKISPAGVVTTLAGTKGYFFQAAGIAVDSAGNIYVADTSTATIGKIATTGLVTTLAGTAGSAGSADGTGPAARFGRPYGIAVDSAGNVYVADAAYSNIRKITPGGVVTTLAGKADVRGTADGMGAAATFEDPTGIAVDSADNVYVTDVTANTIRKITTDGMVSTIVGRPGANGYSPGDLPGKLSSPQGVALCGTTLYTTTNNAIAQVTNVP